MKRLSLWIYSIVIIIVVFISVLLFPFSQLLELKTKDLRARLSGDNQVVAPVVILAIDDISFEKINIRWPWPRQILAEAIIALKDSGAKVIGLDIMMGDAGYTLDEDDALADAMAYAENVIIPIKREVRKSGEHSIEYFDMAIPLFSKSAHSYGYVNLLLDRDNYIRKVLPTDNSFGILQKGFSFTILEALEEIQHSANDKIMTTSKWNIPLSSDNSFLINYAKAGAFAIIPFYKILDGTANLDQFKDKIVLIGSFYKESHDQFLTPSEDKSGLYGIEIHANIINTVYSQNFLVENPRSLDLTILFVLIVMGTILFVRIKPLKGLISVVLLISFYGLISFIMYSQRGIIIELFDPLIALFMTWLGAVLYNYLIVEKEKKFVRSTFSRFVSAEVVDAIFENENDIELGGELREVTIFFSDICGFTSMSENMSPGKVVEMLNEYFTKMTDIIFKYEGTLNKYIGDAIMAIYGAPVQMENNSERAVRASLEMREKLKLFNEERILKGDPPVNIGMGLHKGKVLVGNIGSPRQMEYTVIGDAVNVCSRIEGLTRNFDTDLLISDDLYGEIRDLVEVKTCDPISVKGKSEKIIVHKVLGLKGGSVES